MLRATKAVGVKKSKLKKVENKRATVTPKGQFKSSVEKLVEQKKRSQNELALRTKLRKEMFGVHRLSKNIAKIVGVKK